MLEAFSITDIGKKRKMNQDYVYCSEQPHGNLPNLFLVADGMGGHKAGDYASKCAAETIVREVQASADREPAGILRQAVEAANREIFRFAGEDENLSGMGTTVVASTCVGRNLFVANVGDSRLYVVNDEIRQITRDHSLVEEMVRLGGIDKNEARVHPDRNIITRAVGTRETVNVDLFSLELSEGDIVLMCSDGLTNMLEDETIRGILQGRGSLEGKAKRLVTAANDNGGKDNIAVILVDPFVVRDQNC